MAERDATARSLASTTAGRRIPAPDRLQVVRAPNAGAEREPSIISIRIDDFAAALVLRDRPELGGAALIVGGDAQPGTPQSGWRAVLAASPAARAEGVLAGMTLRAAEKLCPHALTLPANPAAIDAAAQEVLEMLGRYTPHVEPEWIQAATGRKVAVTNEQQLARRFGATLDVHGCERLFGRPAIIAAAIGASLAARGFQARIGVAANPSLAAVAAAVAAPDNPVEVQDGQEQTFLQSLPLALFNDFDPRVLERLHALGIRTAGQFAHLPERAVQRRFGQTGRIAHEQARGAAQRPVVSPPAPSMVDVACDLEDATADGLWLDRELMRLADLLAAKLAMRGQSAAVLRLTIAMTTTIGTRSNRESSRGSGISPRPTTTHPSGGTPAGTSRRCAGDTTPRGVLRTPEWVPGSEGRSVKLHLKQPVAGAPAILDRARELLVQLAPDRPVVSLRLEAAGLDLAATQGTLLGADPILAGRERLEVLAHRLRGRFGPRAARRVQLVADAPLPEDRVTWDGPGNLVTFRTSRIEVRVTASGLPAAVRRDPRAWESLRAVCSQWRIRTNWWSTPTHRYYYLVETMQGAVLEIYQEQRDGSWYLSGRRD